MCLSLTRLADTLQTLFSTHARRLARTTGLIRRQRKLTGPDLARGLVFGWTEDPNASLDELTDDLINDYEINGKRSLGHAKRRVKKHLKPFFTGRFVSAITTVEVRKFVASRQRAGASNARSTGSSPH